MIRRFVALGLAAAVVLLPLLSAPLGVAAQTAGRLPLNNVDFSGTLNGGAANGQFTGVVADAAVVTDETGQLLLTGNLSGTLVTPADRIDVAPQPVRAPIWINAGIQCDSLNLALGRLTLTAPAADITLAPVTVGVTPESVNGAPLHETMCALSKQLEAPVGMQATIAETMNQLLRLFAA